MKYTALITGASGGIGMEMAKLFAKNSINVVLVARSANKLNELASELEYLFQVKATVIVKDLSQPTAPQEIFDELKAKGITIEYLINNAGFGDNGYFHNTDWKKEEQMINLNITSLTALTKLYIKEMVERDSGRILNVASTAAFQPGPLMAVYYASKAYVLSFTEAIASELKETNVTVTALCPGPTDSGFQSASNMDGSVLFEYTKLPSSEEVAKYGYKKMMEGKVVAIHGFANKIGTFAIRFSPRSLTRKVVKALNKKAA